jgi:uncharacterized protein (TIGR03437 family)
MPLNQAWFLNPMSIAFSNSGDLYIAETGACLIREISAAGVLSTFAGTGTCGTSAPTGNAKTADLPAPLSIAIDSQNRVWVADQRVNFYSISQDGTITNIGRTPVTTTYGQLAVDSKDRVYILSSASLYRLLADGTYQTVIPLPTGPGAPPAGTLDELSALGVDPSKNVYFQNRGDIYLVNDDATYTFKFSNQLSYASSLAADASGTVWQADYNEIDTSGRSGLGRITGFHGGYAGDGGFAQSAGYSAVTSVAFAPDGDLYFLDDARIRRFSGPEPASPPAISQSGIVNAASYAGGPIAPGELISIFGSNFGAPGLEIGSAVNNRIPFSVGRTKVFLNNLPGTITAVTPNQINVFVRYDLTYATSVTLVVQVDDALSTPVTLPIVPAAPGLSTLDGSGSGQGAILNQDGSINSVANPAARGSIVSLFGTGEGATMPQLDDGSLVISTPFPTPVNRVSVSIGGQPAMILYAGDAPALPTGVFQINVEIPENLTSGMASIVLTVGGSSTTQVVTVAVK